MSKNYKILSIIFIVLLVILFLLSGNVKADSFNLNVTANKKALKPGDTVELTLKLSNINAGELGINTLEGTLEYDTSIFEEVTQSSFQSLNNWSLTYNNEETESKGKILAVIITAGVTKDQEIGKITLKVKNDVKYTNTTIKIKNIASNNGQELIKETDKEVKFEVGTKPQDTNTNTTNNTTTNNTTTNNTNTNKNNILTNNTNNNNNKTNTTKNIIVEHENISQGKLPQTGTNNSNIYLTIGGAVLVIVIIVSYVKYRQANGK